MVELLRGRVLGQRPEVAHGFTIRTGGVSEGQLATLNLGARATEVPERLLENWKRVADQLVPGTSVERVAVLDQVHGAEVVHVHAPLGPLRAVGRADAAFTTVPDVVLAVRAADCVPVVLGGAGVVGVAHAGWRGTAAGVVPAVVGAIRREVGDVPLWAAVGPCISGPSYEVGSEVVAALRAAGLRDRDFLLEGQGRAHVDLGRAVLAQLAAEGVEADRIERDTATDPALYSHRRDGPGTGRSAGVVVLR